MSTPFTYTVGSFGESLTSIARKHMLSPNDLRRWNPSLTTVAHNPTTNTAAVAEVHDEESAAPTNQWYASAEGLPVGTIVQLPPSLCIRGRTYGESFLVGDYATSLHGALSRALEVTSQTTEEYKRPVRTVRSKQDQAKSLLTARSLMVASSVMDKATGVDPTREVVLEEMSVTECARVTSGITNETGIDLQEDIAKMVNSFDTTPLECLHPSNQELFQQNAPTTKKNLLSDSRVQTIPDPSLATINKSADVVLNFAFLEPRSICVLRDVWSVLSSQNIGTLIDAIQCRNDKLAYTPTLNRFLFIGGVFYVDDRHEGWLDTTEPIRNWVPSTLSSNGGGDANDQQDRRSLMPYGPCPVRRVSQTTFADVEVKMNEMCLFRHIGSCDHKFYLVDARQPGSGIDDPTHVHQFPRRTYYATERSINCDVCAKLPASIASYGDALCPHNPTLFCKPCFAVSHCDVDGNEVDDGYIKYELPAGTYF